MNAFEVQFRQELIMTAQYYGLSIDRDCVGFRWRDDGLQVAVVCQNTQVSRTMPTMNQESFRLPFRGEFQRNLLLDLLASIDGVRANTMSKQDIMYRRIEGASINEYQTKGTHKIYVKHLNTPLDAPPRSLLNGCCL